MTATNEQQSAPDDDPAATSRGSVGKTSARARGKAGRTDGRKSEQFRVRRFDADRTDEVLTYEEAVSSRPTKRQLLWIDMLGDLSSSEADTLAARFKLDLSTWQAFQRAGDRPHLGLSGTYFHVRVAAEPDAARPRETTWLDVIAGRNVVISQHRKPIGFLDNLDERIEADTTLGVLDSATFVASMLDSAVTSYFSAVDAIEDTVDMLDARSLSNDRQGDLLDDLVAVRRRIARLRRVLTDHRQVFASLAAADLAQVVERPQGVAAFKAVAARFEGAVGAVEASRGMLLGSFDVHMTRTAQRTNDIMKVLALTTVLLLPGSLVAGLLGMNVTVPLSKEDPLSFWIVVAGVLTFVLVLLIAARLRRWL
jgi:magnesium transporter